MKKIILFIFFSMITFGQSTFWKMEGLFGGDVTYAGGSKGDGVTDDYLALQTYMDNNTTLDLTAAAGKTFLISQPLRPNTNQVITLGSANIKMQDGDSCLLITDWLYLKDSFSVADPSMFSVGQYVGITQDVEAKAWTGATLYAFSSGSLLQYGWVDRIRAISGNKIFLDSALSYVDTVEVSKNARIGHVQSVFVLENVDNVTITGTGTIDCNGFSSRQIKIHPVYSISGYGENTKAGVGIAIQNCKNIVINGESYSSPLNIVNGITHNVTVTAQAPALSNDHSEDVRLSYVNLNKARMKNLWVRETDTLTVNVALCDSALREDAIVGYTNVAVMTVDSAFITAWGRHGLLFNGNSGGTCDSLNATNIFLSYPLSTTTSAITLKGTRAWVNGFTISNGSTNRNRIAVTNQYDGTNNINFLNGTFTSVNDTAIISIQGDIGRVNFTNMVLNNCTGTAVRVDTFATGTPDVDYDGFPDSVYFSGGSISGLTGSNFSLEQSVIKDSTKFSGTGFVYAMNKPTALTVVMDSVSITPSWTDPTGDDGTYDSIYVYSSATNDTTAAAKIAAVDINSSVPVQTYANTGLTDGTVKFYWLKTKDILGNTSYFSAKTFGLVLTSAATKLWLEDDVANITKNANNKVTNWDDLTTEDHDVAQADTSKAPTWSSSGLLFDGVNDFMKAVAYTTEQAFNIYVVFKQITWTNLDYICDGNTDARIVIAQNATTPGLVGYAGSTGTQNDELAVGSFGLVTMGVRAANSRMRVNNNAEVNVSLGTNNNTGFCLGSAGSGTSAWSHIQVRAFIYRIKVGGLDDAAVQTNIRNYLNAKYNLW